MDTDKIKHYFNTLDRYAKLSGMELTQVAPGRATAVMKVEERHLNGVRMLHGGAIFTLADFALAAASNSDGTVAVSINASICYTKAGLENDTIYARAEQISASRKLGTYRIVVSNQNDEKLADFQGMVYKKGGPLPVEE